MDTQVTVIGAGPVGLTLAMDLAQRGVDVTFVERRAGRRSPDAKCNTVGGADHVGLPVPRRRGRSLAAALADDFPTEVY